MQHIMNNRRPHIRNLTRSHFEFNNGYNRLPRSSKSNDSSNAIIEEQLSYEIETNYSDEEEGIALQYRLFNVIIDICANIITSELPNFINPRPYYSTFQIDEHDVRFFHEQLLNSQNIGYEMEYVIGNIDDRTVQQILNTNNAQINSEEIIKKINNNVARGEYINYVSILKNHTCPILLNDFVNTDIISIFKLCNHAIDESTYEKYVKTFTKCPLCNHKLF